MEFHRPRMKALIEAGADVLACETIPNVMEARAIARLLEEFEERTHGLRSAQKMTCTLAAEH